MRKFTKVLLTLSIAAPLLAGCVLFGNEPSEFSLTGQPSVEVNAATQNVEVGFKCDRIWEASMKSGLWASVSKESLAEDNVTASVTLAVKYNPTDAERKDTLIISSGSKVLMTEIVQQGLSSYISSTLLALDNTATLTVNSVYPWEIQAGEGKWYKAEPSSGQAGKATIEFSCLPGNDNLEAMTGTAYFVSGKDKVELSLVHGQVDAVIVTPLEVSLPFLESAFYLQASYNVDVEVNISASWIKLAGTKSMQESELEFIAQRNTSTESRKASIVLKSKTDASLIQTVAVEQAGEDPLVNLSVWGIYSSTDEPTVIYSKGLHQTGRTYKDGGVSFRLMDVSAKNVVVVKGFAEDFREGDKVTLKVKSGSTPEKTYEALLIRLEDDTAWLRAEDGTGFIIMI